MPRYGNYDDLDDDYDIRIPRHHDSDRDVGLRPHSGVGLISIGCAVVALIGYFISFGMLIAIEAGNNPPMQEDDPEAIVLGLGIMGSIGANILGLILGIAGCFQSDRNITCPIIGTVLNGIFLVGLGALVILGLIANG